MSEPTPEQRVHDLKVWPEYYTAILFDLKPFEIRRNDRDFRVGDVLLLREFDPSSGKYTGEEVRRRVAYMTNFEQKENFVVMTISRDFT